MNSKSDSLFRYCAVSGFMLSPCTSSAAQVVRSARLTTVLRHVQQRRGRSAAGQDETTQHGQPCVELVAGPLEAA